MVGQWTRQSVDQSFNWSVGGLVVWVDGRMEGWYFVFSSNCIYTYVRGFCWHFLFFFCSVVVIVVIDVVIVVVVIVVVIVIVVDVIVYVV